MHFKCLLFTTLLFLIISVSGAEKTTEKRIKLDKPTVKIVADETPLMLRIPPPASYTNKSGSVSNGAKITVTYDGFTNLAKASFQKAVDIWASLIQSPVEIKIEAHWRNLGAGTLGSCGPTNYYLGYDGMPEENTYYPISLAEKLAGKDLNDSTDFEMIANFNNSAAWYYGTDGNTPSDKYDLLTVVLHEICHGLGFIGSLSVDNGRGSWGWGTDSPFIFDHHIVDSDKVPLINTSVYPNNSTKLKTALTSGLVYFEGPLLLDAFGKSVLMYAPANWDEGSSIYHVSTVYASSNNGLMNQSLNRGKSVHDPGVIAMGILGEIGWKQIRFQHEPLINTEKIENVTISTNIITDFDTPILNPKLYYSKDSSDYVEVNLSKNSTDTTLYTATIPITSSVYVSYYMTSNDKYGRDFKMPVNAPEISYSFYVGTDTISPNIKHYPINYLLPGQDTILFNAQVTDGFGVDSVWLEYWINDGEKEQVGMPNTKDTQYKILLDISQFNVAVGDSIHYRIAAADKSIAGNIGYSPREGTEKMVVEAIPDFVESLENDFEKVKNDFILQDFEITQPEGFSSRGLHTLHPYPFAGEESYMDFIAQIRYPIKVAEQNHYISFDEIVLIEPGEAGTVWGDEEFWDYVIVEASKNSGNTWMPLEPGWDCRLYESWEKMYNQSIAGQFSQAVGNQSMYRNHLINLLVPDQISVGDEILIRFRMNSDPFANGWGWAIDNLKIQTSNVGSKLTKVSNTMKVYPNPISEGYLTIESNSEAAEEVTLLNLQGAVVYRKTLAKSEKRIKLPEELKGFYMLMVKTENRTEQFKVMVK